MELWFVKILGFLDQMNGCKPDFTECFLFQEGNEYICYTNSAETCSHS